MTDARLTRLAERIDRLEEERKATAADIADVYKEAKGHGYNTTALRKVLAERRKPTDETLAAEIEKYRAALGVPGATYRAVAEQLGVSKSKLQRLVPHATNGTAHGPLTGEVHESSGGVEGHALSGQDEEAATVEAGPIVEAGPMAKATAEADLAAGVEPGPLDTSTDTLEIPPFLRRVRAA